MYLILYSFLYTMYFITSQKILFSYSFLYTTYFVTSHKILFSCISSLSCVQRLFSKMKLVKTSLHTQLKHTNLENRFNISAENPKGFNDIAFQHSVDELKHCNPYIGMDLQLVPVLLCLYSIYLVVMLLSVIFVHIMFYFISFPCVFAVF